MGVLRAVRDRGGPLCGRPPRDHRRTLDALFWIARTGALWRDLPEELGNWNSVHRQFRRWTTNGLWDLMLTAPAKGGGGDALQMIDSTTVPRSALGRPHPLCPAQPYRTLHQSPQGCGDFGHSAFDQGVSR
jgi:transposase